LLSRCVELPYYCETLIKSEIVGFALLKEREEGHGTSPLPPWFKR